MTKLLQVFFLHFSKKRGIPLIGYGVWPPSAAFNRGRRLIEYNYGMYFKFTTAPLSNQQAIHMSNWTSADILTKQGWISGLRWWMRKL